MLYVVTVVRRRKSPFSLLATAQSTAEIVSQSIVTIIVVVAAVATLANGMM